MLPIGNMRRFSANIGPGSLQLGVCIAQSQPARILAQHLHAPPKARTEPQRAMMIKPAMIEIRGRHMRRNAFKAFRLFGRGKQLRGALIRKPVHADESVARRMLAQPRNGFSSIAALVTKWIERAF